MKQFSAQTALFKIIVIKFCIDSSFAKGDAYLKVKRMIMLASNFARTVFLCAGHWKWSAYMLIRLSEFEF